MTKYILSYKTDKYTSITWSYDSSDKTVIYNDEHREPYLIPCMHKDNLKSVYSNRLESKLLFSSEAQQNEFEDALRNKETRTALRLLEVLEPCEAGEKPWRLKHMNRMFFSDYIAEQEKIKTYNKGYFVTHGLFKSKSIPFEEVNAGVLQGNSTISASSSA